MVNGTHPHRPDTTFQSKDTHEHFQFYFHQHWIRLVQPLLTTLFWSALLAGAAVMFFVVMDVPDASTRHGLLIGLYICFAGVHIAFLMRFYRYFLYAIIVTDRKVHRIKKTLFSIDDHQTIDIWTLQEIQKNQHGIVQNLFGFGSLILEAQDTKLRLHFVPRISAIYERLCGIRELARDISRQHVVGE